LAKARGKVATRVPVGRVALVARINRRLAENNEQLRASKSAAAKQEMGDYYIVNTQVNGITNSNLDLEDLAREMKCLQPWEMLVEKGDAGATPEATRESGPGVVETASATAAAAYRRRMNPPKS